MNIACAKPNMVFSILKKTLLEAQDWFESFRQIYDFLWFLFRCDVIPSSEELHVINSNQSQDTIAKNSFDTLPSWVSHKMSKKNVTLVLDLDGNFPLSL